MSNETERGMRITGANSEVIGPLFEKVETLMAEKAALLKDKEDLVEALTNALRWMDGFDDRYLVKDDYSAKLTTRSLLARLSPEHQGVDR